MKKYSIYPKFGPHINRPTEKPQLVCTWCGEKKVTKETLKCHACGRISDARIYKKSDACRAKALKSKALFDAPGRRR